MAKPRTSARTPARASEAVRAETPAMNEDTVSDTVQTKAEIEAAEKEANKKGSYAVLVDHTIIDGKPLLCDDVVTLTAGQVASHREHGLCLSGPLSDKEVAEYKKRVDVRKKAA